MSTITFARPELFYLLLGLIPMIVWYVLQQKKSKASIQISTLESLKKAPLTWKHSLRHAAFILQIGVLALVIAYFAQGVFDTIRAEGGLRDWVWLISMSESSRLWLGAGGYLIAILIWIFTAPSMQSIGAVMNILRTHHP